MAGETGRVGLKIASTALYAHHVRSVLNPILFYVHKQGCSAVTHPACSLDHSLAVRGGEDLRRDRGELLRVQEEVLVVGAGVLAPAAVHASERG